MALEHQSSGFDVPIGISGFRCRKCSDVVDVAIQSCAFLFFGAVPILQIIVAEYSQAQFTKYYSQKSWIKPLTTEFRSELIE